MNSPAVCISGKPHMGKLFINIKTHDFTKINQQENFKKNPIY